MNNTEDREEKKERVTGDTEQRLSIPKHKTNFVLYSPLIITSVLLATI